MSYVETEKMNSAFDCLHWLHPAELHLLFRLQYIDFLLREGVGAW